MSPGRKNRKMSVAMRARRRGKKEDQEMPSTSVDAEVMDAGEGAAVTTKNAKKNGQKNKIDEKENCKEVKKDTNPKKKGKNKK